MIELILKKDVEHLGRQGEIVRVANGYARNYLLPRELALAVTAGNRKQIEHEQKMAARREAEEKSAAEALAKAIALAEVVIARKVGEKDTLYGSVTSSDVAASLAEQGFQVDRRKIQLPDPIKRVGEVMVPIKLHRAVTAELRVRVVPDEVPETPPAPAAAAEDTEEA